MPDDITPGNYTTNVTINSGPYQGVISATNQVTVSELGGAKFQLHKDFNVRTENDTITNGVYKCNAAYNLGVKNIDDATDTVLGNIRFEAQAENITDVYWREYAVWNKTSVNWTFPSDFIVNEDEWFFTDGVETNYTETKYLNVDVNRELNQTIFNDTAYQWARFTVTFKDTDFLWVWGDIGARERWEVNASIVPGTFATNAPLDWIDENQHWIHLDFNKDQTQTNVTYTFYVVVKVELTGNEAPPILYKPEFHIGKGLYWSTDYGGEGYTAVMPLSLLPENVNHASMTTNVSNVWKLTRVNHTIAILGEVVELAGPHAEFHCNKDFNIWTENDTIHSGTYESDKWYWMHIENVKDTSGTILSNLSFSAKADNITDVDWEEYAEWNESYVEWIFLPYPRFTIEEDEGFGTGFSRGTEIRNVNMSVCRWMNITEFDSSGYQLAKFNVTFDDTNFEWAWAHIEVNNHHEVKTSIVPGTFTHDAPFDNFDAWDHGIHFDFDSKRIETGVTYNFSVLVKVEFTGKETPPILYKPRFEIGEGLYHNSTTLQGYKYTAEMPSSMLPDNVSYASASTNVSNAWLIKRHNHMIAGLEEVSELAGPHALFSTDKVFPVATKNDTILSGTYERNMWCGLNIKNSADTSDTVLGDLRFCAQADNITVVHWEEHAVWNETSAAWAFPPDFVIYEDEWFGARFGTNHTEVRHLNVEVSRQMNQTRFNDSDYQLANFTVTFEDTDFQWCGGRIEANEHYEVNASIVPGTFESDAPLDWIDESEHGVHFGFDRDAIEPGVAYNFSVAIKIDLAGNRAPPIVYKPQFFINVELEKSFAPGGEGFTAEMPAEMLPSYVNNASVTTNISNNWTLRQVNRTIVRLKEVHGSTRIEAWLLNVYMNPLLAIPNTTFLSGIHDNYKFVVNRLENPTPNSTLSPSVLLETRKPVMGYDLYSGEDVKEFCYELVAENASNFNWSLYNISPHEAVETGVILNELEPVNLGYNASVSVDKFEFSPSTPSEQNLNITVDVYDNSSMDIIWIETRAKNTDFISAEFVNWTSDIEPEDFGSEGAFWIFEKPENRTYTFSIKLNVTPYSQCVYRPGIEIIELNFTDKLVNSSSSIAETTWAGNCTISTREPYDWVVYRGNVSVSSFEMIAVENYTTISGYVRDENKNPIENTLVFVNAWNESKNEYQDYAETSTNESGYYEAFVKGNEKYKITAGWTRQDYTTEEVENITSLPHTENFTLHNASVVCGGVFDANKKSMQGVEVMVVNESNITISSDFTNEDGYYRQLKIPEHGNYTVKVEGYDSNELELSDVGKGEAMLHNFVVELSPIFDTGPSKNPYPSIMGIHNGTIKPSQNISVSRLYTYPCTGTGGHTESIKLYENSKLIASGTWSGYKGDWHSISLHNLTGGTPYVTLLEDHDYNYTIRTGSYPQIIHNQTLTNEYGTITCTKFIDVNGRVYYYDWIPAIRLE